jgi:excisionase family DNA binding protein
MEQAYFTLNQASEILQISERTIQRRIKDGKIPKANFCGRILIPAWFLKQGLEKEFEIKTVEKED